MVNLLRGLRGGLQPSSDRGAAGRSRHTLGVALSISYVPTKRIRQRGHDKRGELRGRGYWKSLGGFTARRQRRTDHQQPGPPKPAHQAQTNTCLDNPRLGQTATDRQDRVKNTDCFGTFPDIVCPSLSSWTNKDFPSMAWDQALTGQRWFP